MFANRQNTDASYPGSIFPSDREPGGWLTIQAADITLSSVVHMVFIDFSPRVKFELFALDFHETNLLSYNLVRKILLRAIFLFKLIKDCLKYTL